MTNWHCGGHPRLGIREADMWEPETGLCENSIVDLSWDEDESSRDYICKAVELPDADLDFVLLRLVPINMKDTASGVTLRRTDIIRDQGVVMIHHPLGEAKRISLDHCSVRDPKKEGWRKVGDGEFTHTCDTEEGSSGAPVFSKDGILVGLHRAGFQVEKNVCDRLNKAVRMGPILGKIHEKRPDLINEIQTESN